MKWRPVFGYEGLYEVSDKGDIRSLVCGGPFGKRKRPASRAVILSKDKNGYIRVGLCKTGQSRKNMLVHRIVLFAFSGMPPVGMECNHIDGDKSNNRISNLEWVTRAENGRHKANTGLAASGDRHGMRLHKGLVAGEKNGRAILCADDAVRIMALYNDGCKIAELARRFSVSESAVASIVHGRSWKHIIENGKVK